MKTKPLIFYYCIVLVAMMAVAPRSMLPHVFDMGDKARHILTFAMLAFTGSLAFPNRLKIVYIGLIFYGAAIELIQKKFTVSHIGDINDLLADCKGIVIGIIVYFAFRQLGKLIKV